MKMKLHDGRSVENPQIEYPIFDLDPTQYDITRNIIEYSETIDNVTFRSIRIDGAGADTQAFANMFPAEIPRRCFDDGNIITARCQYEFDATIGQNGTWVLSEQSWGNTTVGTKPDDWGVNRYNYYLIWTEQTSGNEACNLYYDNAVNPSTSDSTGFTVNYENSPWDSTQVYSLNENSDPRKNMTHVFTCNNGSTFGISHTISYRGSGHGGVIDYLSVGIEPIFGNTLVNSDFMFSPLGNHNFPTYGNIRPRGFSDQVTIDSRNMQDAKSKRINIFISYEYNGVTYYGIALIRMNNLLDTARPILMYAVLYDENFWGDALVEGGGSHGNWGDDSTIAGGDGTFSAPTNDRGTGGATDVYTELSTVITSLTSVFTGNGGFNIHQILPAAIPYVMGVLYSTDFITRYQQSMYDPLSAILSMHLLPANLIQASQTSTHITASGYDISSHMASGAPATLFPEVVPMKVHHVGTINIGNFFGAFPDYSPHTECILHLPYIGTIKIDTNAIMYGKLSVDYSCDAMSGNVCAWIWCSDREGRCNYKYMASGNAAYNIPVVARNNSGFDVGKLFGNVIRSGVFAASGMEVPALLSLGSAAADFVTPAIHKSTIVEGTFSGNVGIISDDMVYLEIIRPEWVEPKSYPDDVGIPAYITGTIAELGATGYIEISEIDLENLEATETEKEELKKILYNGFWYIPAE